MRSVRKPNLFEHILLFLGIAIVGIGYGFVHITFLEHGLYSFQLAQAILMWFGVILLVVLISVHENAKEELRIIIKQQQEEIKLLRNDLRRRR